MKPSEAAPPAPASAATVFGGRLGLAERYADALAREATVRGLIGPAEVPRLWERHLVNCAVLGELVPSGSRVVDVGSGAGLPGIPLALARPDLSVVLVEPLLRRSGWLEDIVDRLQLASVRVVRSRAEELHGSLSAPVVTARAVAPMQRLARWCLPLVEPGGQLLAIKGRGAEAELHEAAAGLRRLGATDWEIVAIGVGILADHTSVIRVRVGTSDGPAPRVERRQSSGQASGQVSGHRSRARSREGFRQQAGQPVEGGGT